MYFQNYFARRSIILESFTSHLQHSRTCFIRYTNYNTAAHVVNSTYSTVYCATILGYSLITTVLAIPVNKHCAFIFHKHV